MNATADTLPKLPFEAFVITPEVERGQGAARAWSSRGSEKNAEVTGSEINKGLHVLNVGPSIGKVTCTNCR